MNHVVGTNSERLIGVGPDRAGQCIRCCRSCAHTRGVLRSKDRAAPNAIELHGLICDGCIAFMTYCSRSTEERLTVVNPAPAALREILKNMLFVAVGTQSDRSLVFDESRRSAFEALLATADDADLWKLFKRLELEIIDRHPRAEEVKTLVKAARLFIDEPVVPAPGGPLAQAFELLAAVDDSGLEEIQELLNKLALARLRRSGRLWAAA
jgi:hypothetical protein